MSIPGPLEVLGFGVVVIVILILIVIVIMIATEWKQSELLVFLTKYFRGSLTIDETCEPS